MSEIKFESTPKIKSLIKGQENIIASKQPLINNRPLFLVKQNQENNNEKIEKNIIQKEELNTNHSNNTTNENFSQEKGTPISEPMLIENKESENILNKENKDKEDIKNNIIKTSSINTNMILNKANPFVVNNTNTNNNNNINNTNNINKNNNTNNINNNTSNPNINHHIENCINNITSPKNNSIINPPNNNYNHINNNVNSTNHINALNNNNNNNNNMSQENYGNKRSLRGHSLLPNTHHLLEDAIIKKEFQEPKRKVNLKNDLPPSYGLIGANDPTKSFQKIISIDESDSFIEEENESDFSQEFEEEDDDDDEEYNISNNNINWLNKRKRENKNANCLFNSNNKRKEYDDPICNELSELIRKYGFDKVIESIYHQRKGDTYNTNTNSEIKEIPNENIPEKNDNIFETNNNQDSNDDIVENNYFDLNKKIKELLPKSNNDDINLLLIRILSDNFTENQQKLIDFVSNKKEVSDYENIPQIELRDADDRFQKRSRSLYHNSNNLDNLGVLKEKRKHTKRPSPPFYYGKHYYKKNGKIYCYVPKAKTVSFNRYTLYCLYRGAKEKCMAKLIVHQNGKDITFVGNHLCKPKMTMEDFNKKYPNIKSTDWTHIQFAFKNQKLIVMNQI